MKRTTVLALGATLGFLGLFTTAAAIAGCSSDDENKTAPQRLSQKNEACQTSNDCAVGLSCIPSRDSVSGQTIGKCVTGEFRISKSAKECVQVQCENKDQCCPKGTDRIPDQFDLTCARALELCNADGGSSIYCTLHANYCNCDKWSCDQSQCVVRQCTTDTECSNLNARHCSAGGSCVQCVDDSHCSSGDTCISGKCKPPCEVDSQCDGYSRCKDRKCVPSGCLSDRECVASTGKVEATCGSDGQCVEPCETDPECDNGNSYNFRKCIDKKCTYMGCESDKECQYAPLSDGGFGNQDPKWKRVCRDRKVQ